MTCKDKASYDLCHPVDKDRGGGQNENKGGISVLQYKYFINKIPLSMLQRVAVWCSVNEGGGRTK